MDSSDFPVSKSPRKELQGPRPAPLKLHKDSHKIKKPPVAPPPQHHRQHHQQQQQQQQHHPPPPAAPPRPPVIIYTVSPKVIHTNPNDFMTLVQRLTGSSSSSSSSISASTTAPFTSSSSYDPLRDHSTGAISPAARYASIERTKISPTTERNNKLLQIHNNNNNNNIEDHHHSFITGGGGGNRNDFVGGIEMDHNIERSSLFPGILSPGPTSLPMISPNFFSPPSDPNNTFSFLHDLSPVVHGNKNFIEGSFMPSPSGFISSPYITSPTPSIDFFNSFFDF